MYEERGKRREEYQKEGIRGEERGRGKMRRKWLIE